MKRAIIPAFAASLMLLSAAQAADNAPRAHAVRVAQNDTEKRTVVKEKPNGAEVRRTTTERPNGAEVNRRVIERPNGSTMSRTVRERPNGAQVVRKVVRAPRRFRAPRRWVAPRGFVYRRFLLGQRVPGALLSATYFLTDFGLYGLEPPPPGYVWVRDGNDAVLVDQSTGEVVQVEYDMFY